MGDISLRVLGGPKGGSFLRELIHLGEGVVPGTATDWTAVNCGANCHRSTQKRGVGCEERQLRCREARGAREHGTRAYLALVIHPLLLDASLGTMKLQQVA
jgi:hypothetical protein